MNDRIILSVLLGLTVQVGAAGGAWADGSVLYGPRTYERTSGPPNTFAATFPNCEPAAQYRLVAMNGSADGGNRVASATILLNSAVVIGPRDLNQTVAQVVRSVSVSSTNRLEVRLAGAPAGRLTVSVECIANCLQIAIAAPADGSSLSQDAIVVTGTFRTSSDEAGVNVNGTIAQVGGVPALFAAADVPLQVGANLLRATVTNVCGMTATATAEVDVPALAERVAFVSASPPGGVAPLDVTLRALAAPVKPVAAYVWNFSASTEPEISVNYAAPGLYLPQVTVTDTSGNRFSATAVVNVLDPDRLGRRLVAKWSGMRAALERGEIEAALEFFTFGSRERYRQIFTALAEQLAGIGRDLPDLSSVSFSGFQARYRIERVHLINGQPEAISYWVYFVQDTDGIWRIRQF